MRVIIKLKGHQHRWLAGGYDMEIGHFQRWIAWWIVAFLVQILIKHTHTSSSATIVELVTKNTSSKRNHGMNFGNWIFVLTWLFIHLFIYFLQDTAELFFDDVRLGQEHLLGKEGHGFKYLMTELPQERLLIGEDWVLFFFFIEDGDGWKQVTLGEMGSDRILSAMLGRGEATDAGFCGTG